MRHKTRVQRFPELWSDSEDTNCVPILRSCTSLAKVLYLWKLSGREFL